MHSEGITTFIEKINNYFTQNVVNNDIAESESQSIFDDSQTQANESNLVPIEDYEQEEKLSFFQRFWQTLFPPKKTENENDVENLQEENSTNNTNLDEDELLRIEDYNKLSKEDPKYTVNGEIDQDFHQGKIADCVLLSSLYSLSRTEEGAAIIKDAIKINYDENGATKSYDVYFKGLDKTYNIPVEEYCEAERLRLQFQRGDVDYYLSAGDDDVLLMELAYQKAFDDITEAKRSSSMFAKTKALESVEYEQFLYAFVGTEDVNTAYWIEEKYKQMQFEQNGPKIRDVFETQQEFKLEDVYFSDVKIAGMKINSMDFNWEDIYIIEQKPSESENGEITIKNKETGEKLVMNAERLVECFADDLTLEQKKQVGLDMYNLAVESDFVFFGNVSNEPIEVKDVNGNTRSICQKHAYGVKEITQEYVVLVNPHLSTEEIKISRDEYLKHYKEMGGFKLFSANFED